MFLFGVGAGTLLVILGSLSRTPMLRVRGKLVWGAAMLLLGLSIMSGAEKRIKAWVVDASPHWLTELTTRF